MRTSELVDLAKDYGDLGPRDAFAAHEFPVAVAGKDSCPIPLVDVLRIRGVFGKIRNFVNRLHSRHSALRDGLIQTECRLWKGR